MSIARDAGVISDAQQKEIDELFTGKDGNFDEEAFAEAFARELKRAFHETVQKRMEDVPTTKAGRALRRVADFIVTLAKSFAFWRQERGLDPVTGQPLQAGQVLDAFLKRERTAVDEATRLDNLARAARAASLRATAEARDNAPTQAVVDEDGTVVAYHTAGMDFGGGMFYVDYKDDISNSACLSALRLAGGNNSTIDSDPIAYSKELRRSRQNVSTVIVPFGITTTYNNGVRDYSSRGGSGFLHIVDERLANEYDELYEKDRDGALKLAIRDALRVIEAIRRGTIVEINGNDRHAERIRIEHKNDSDFETYCAILYWDRREKTFSLITGFKKDPSLAKTQVDARTGKSSVVHRRSEFQTSEYYGHLKRKLPELTRQIVAELFPELQVENRKADPNEERRNHISDLYTGGPVPYWKPNLAYVGSNSGRQGAGWGHYAANMREGAVVHVPEGGAVMRQTWWTHRPEGDESHLLVDGEPLSEENAERVAQTIVHLKEEYGVTTREMDEKFWPYFDDANMTGDMAYRMVEEFFRLFTDIENPARAASRALYMHDIDGVKIPLGEETDADGKPTGKQMANYVAFSDENLRVDGVEQWNPETWRFEAVEDPNEERRDHVHVWSGARQAYDRVDLRFIGSGTGGNNEGRGAYSSGVRGVAQDKYARGALGSLTYTADNIPVVYDGKSMTLKEAYGLARETAYRNDEIDEGWMIREINYQAGQLSSDNAIVGGLVDYNELREWMLEEFENESEPLTYEEVLADFSKLKALPIERRMGYDYGGGFDTRRYEGKDDKIIRSEMRDFYVDKDRFGFVHYRDVEEANRLYEEILAKMPKDSRKGNTRQKKLELLDKVLPELPEARPAVMEQTWFTNRPEGDVSHLLNWFEAVTPEQLGWIVEGARKAGFSEKEIAFLQRERIDDDDVLIEDGNRMPSGREMYMRLEVISFFRTKKKNAAYLRMQERLRRNPFEERPTEEETKGETFDAVTTEDLRRAHRDVMGDAGKFASEFLVSADIDGMMYPVDYRHGNRDGRVSGWNYVAFSDEHLRVDHVYEYNPETDDFELKWHEGVGSAPRFTETPLGQELVARAFDAIMGSRVDLLLRPSRYYGNPYETRERNPRNALVTEHLHRDVDVSEPRGFATEVSAEISRFGTREGDPTLREIRARCGSKARFYEVLGAVYETAEAVRSGLAEVVTGRERAMMSNAGLQAADFIKHNATARATAAGRKLYLMGREFAWKLYQEDIASAWAEVERQRRGRGDCGMIGGKCEGKGPSRHGERRWPKARRMR